jgi:hypothetical protein
LIGERDYLAQAQSPQLSVNYIYWYCNTYSVNWQEFFENEARSFDEFLTCGEHRLSDTEVSFRRRQRSAPKPPPGGKLRLPIPRSGIAPPEAARRAGVWVRCSGDTCTTASLRYLMFFARFSAFSLHVKEANPPFFFIPSYIYM